MKGTRVGYYLHKEGLSGGSLAKILTKTDFASRTDEVRDFANRVAKLAFGAQTENFSEVLEMFPSLEGELAELSNNLGEKVVVDKLFVVEM